MLAQVNDRLPLTLAPRARSLRSRSFSSLLLTQHLLGSCVLVVIRVVSAVRPKTREDIFGGFLWLGLVVILQEDFP